MNYASIVRADIANGNGFRVSLFVCGCNRRCPGCFNAEAQNPEFGGHFGEAAKQKIFKELKEKWCQGLSLLGGDPLSQLSDNRKVIIDLCREVKQKFPTKDIWCWSGYTLEEIKADPSMSGILDWIDVLVDGPFVEELKDPAIPFRGSKNQRILKKGIDF